MKPQESVAPRGQVYNVRAVLEGRLDLSVGLASEIYDCLACRGCESVCPAGVPVGSIMEDARSLLTSERLENAPVRWSKKILLSGVLGHPRRLAMLMTLARFYQASGLRFLVERMLAVVAPGLAERAKLLPRLSSREALPELRPSSKKERRKRVALFTGCIASHLFADVNAATARVLQRNGFEVVVPRAQRCCGALHLHNGLSDTGRTLARRNIEIFEETGAEAVVVNAAGCGAALSEYGELLGEPRASAFARKVVDISAFLVREGFEAPEAPFNSGARVAYDAPCHLFHGQRVTSEPGELLSRIPGVELVPYRDSERCCGSAGIYNVTRYRMSMQVLESKMRELRKARPDVIATGNPGCHLQLSEGVRRFGLQAEVAHPITLLDRAYRNERR